MGRNSLTDYEKARAERVAANQAKMASLGIAEAATQLQVAAADSGRSAVPRPTPRKRRLYEVEVEVRRSGRLQGSQPEYNEENLFARELGIDRLDLIARPRRRRVGIDPSQLSSIRERRIREVDGDDAEIPRGPVDSGLGVRIQGGRVYDSKYGVTCHWCRQKTLEEHVTCTHPDCGGGRRLAVSFCKLCLRNRHGEDILQAEASGAWVCPRCRGSCGDGCAACCNCGPCRKALGIAPTHQIIGLARAAGFDNVHDFLVHQRTGEGPEDVAARKRQAAWGAWLDVPFDRVAAAAAAAGSDQETEDEEAPAETAAAAAAVQLAARRGRSGRVPEGAGAALLLLAALQRHLLVAAFCRAVQALVPKRCGRPPQAPAAKKPAAEAQAKLAQRRSGRSGSPAASAATKPAARLASKVTAFFQAAAPGSAPKQAPAAAPKAAAAAAPRASNRLGMRARR